MNYYETLGIEKTASAEQIKRNYRLLAKQYHPDTNPNDLKAEDKFKKILEAYENLIDPLKRAKHDSTIAGPQNFNNSSKKSKRDLFKEKEQNKKETWTAEELDKINCQFFGNSLTGRNIIVHANLTPNERLFGGSKLVKIKKRIICMQCNGDGKIWESCRVCKDKKLEKLNCQECGGYGNFEYKCEVCDGLGLKNWTIKQVLINLPQNSQPGQTITVLGEGEDVPNKPPGNLRVVLI